MPLTGEREWHFQMVHHDFWDYDAPCQPALITIRRNGRTIDAVAQMTKMGLVFLFERETGKPIFPIEERPVPKSNVPGEEMWPTQPFPRQTAAAQPPRLLEGRHHRHLAGSGRRSAEDLGRRAGRAGYTIRRRVRAMSCIPAFAAVCSGADAASIRS